MRRLLLTLAVLLLFPGPLALATPARVLLLRHGEKPSDGGDDLSPIGWQRAAALPALFDRPEFSGAPVALYAQKPQKDGSQIRPFETLRYVATRFQLPIRTDFARDDYQGLVSEMQNSPELDGKFVVVCWEHKVLEEIAHALGVNPKPNYPDPRFDRAWLLRFTDPESPPQFQNLPERLLPGDDSQ